VLADPLTKRNHDGMMLRQTINERRYSLTAEGTALLNKLRERQAKLSALVSNLWDSYVAKGRDK
jgi:hypothetical protein